jgi:hypothetical protein
MPAAVTGVLNYVQDFWNDAEESRQDSVYEGRLFLRQMAPHAALTEIRSRTDLDPSTLTKLSAQNRLT